MAVKEEAELYEPVKRYFETQGYEVKGEVLHCDLVAIKPRADTEDGIGIEEEVIIVEMKRTFNLALLLQGVERLRMNPLVTLVVERNRKKSGAVNQRFGDITELCRMLGLGLMTVTLFKTKPALVEMLCEPGDPPRARYRAKRHDRLLREFRERSGDYNVGGSTKRKLMTAYREKCLRMADVLRHGPASPATLARMTSNSKAGDMLRTNYYGWFERAERGIYRLTAQGTAALTEHAEVIAGWPVQETAVTADENEVVSYTTSANGKAGAKGKASSNDSESKPKKRSRKKKPERV
ncbi:hypothetical protein H8B09_02185 [Paenibacillus sp. PR3]|uniref:Uncharacterized protein n=1 Tax=Paenibacillus terricola TaxID=2763503 RepID=A0ABR8MSN5_9BACL|nr:DUF2161 family putative PD-(D/E)XK-type phosphodiesterase [Paenibacillus terricola]MBD3917549.1 hypothetical protein [Paenibacillus terricola]